MQKFPKMGKEIAEDKAKVKGKEAAVMAEAEATAVNSPATPT